MSWLWYLVASGAVLRCVVVFTLCGPVWPCSVSWCVTLRVGTWWAERVTSIVVLLRCAPFPCEFLLCCAFRGAALCCGVWYSVFRRVGVGLALGYAMLCYVVPCHVMWCGGVSCGRPLWCVTLWFVAVCCRFARWLILVVFVLWRCFVARFVVVCCLAECFVLLVCVMILCLLMYFLCNLQISLCFQNPSDPKSFTSAAR